MGRKGISYEDTKVAIERLLARGEAPTVARVRTELGDTGSVTTIGRYKRQWEAEQGERSTPGVPPLPDPLVKSLVQGAEAYWNELMQALAAREQEIEAQATAAVDQAQAMARQASDERDTAKAHAEALAGELDQARTRLEQLSTRLTETHTELQRELARREGADRLNLELKDQVSEYRARLAQSEQLRLQQAQEQEKRLAAEREAARAVQTSLERQLQQAQQALQTTQDHFEALRREHAALGARFEAERAALTLRLEELRSELATLIEQNRQQVAQLSQEQARVNRLTGELQQVRETLASAEKSHRTERAELEQQIRLLQRDLIRLELKSS